MQAQPDGGFERLPFPPSANRAPATKLQSTRNSTSSLHSVAAAFLRSLLSPRFLFALSSPAPSQSIRVSSNLSSPDWGDAFRVCHDRQRRRNRTVFPLLQSVPRGHLSVPGRRGGFRFPGHGSSGTTRTSSPFRPFRPSRPYPPSRPSPRSLLALSSLSPPSSNRPPTPLLPHKSWGGSEKDAAQIAPEIVDDGETAQMSMNDGGEAPAHQFGKVACSPCTLFSPGFLHCDPLNALPRPGASDLPSIQFNSIQ